MKRLMALTAVAAAAATLAALTVVAPARAGATTEQKIHVQLVRYYHADGYIKAIGRVAHRTIYSPSARIRHKWQRAVRWLMSVRLDASRKLYALRHPYRAPARTLGYWAAKQIAAAESIGRSSRADPWPNCPDPIFGGGPWWNPSNPGDKGTTLGCENGGSWYDSPGFYRCGLQFDPSWERVYGRLCP